MARLITLKRQEINLPFFLNIFNIYSYRKSEQKSGIKNEKLGEIYSLLKLLWL